MTILESSLDTTAIGWSKNKIWFEIETSADWQDHEDYLLFGSVGKSGATEPFVKIRLSPDPIGHVRLEVQEFVNGQINYFLPIAGTPHAVDEPHDFWLKISETKNAVTTHETINFKAIKAGSGEEPEILQAEWFDQKRFLTLVAGEKPTTTDVPEYLYYYQESGSLPLNVKVYFSDETTEEYVAYTVNFAGKTMICPVGFEALDIAGNSAGKTPVAYEVSLGTSETIRYTLSDLFVEKRIFLYANTLSGFDTLLCEGNWESKFQTDKTIIEAVALNQKVRKVNKVNSRRTGKVATSWLSDRYLSSLTDFYESPEIYELVDNQYVPIVVTGAFTYSEKNGELVGLQFDFEYLERKAKLKRL